MANGVTIFCFAAAYGVALALELAHLARPARWLRILILLASAAGLVAQTIYLAQRGWPLQGTPSSLLFLSWILAIFHLGGTLHRRVTWGIFVLPIVLGMVLLAGLAVEGYDLSVVPIALRSWAWLHFALLVLGAVGLSVAFVASLMYLVQAHRLRRHKVLPGEGVRLLSLERLETMHRRATGAAFILFTAGLLIGVALLVNTRQLDWWDPKVVSTLVMWAVFAVLTHLRYVAEPHGKRVAVWTVVAFGLMIVAFAIQLVSKTEHPSGGGP